MGYQNFFATKLFTDIGAADTSITLETVPTATSGRLVLEARNPTQREVIKYTGVAGNQITGVTRGQGGTTAKGHLKGALTEMNATSEDLQDLYDAFASFAATNGSGWLNAGFGLTYLGNNGNGEFTGQFNGDVTGFMNPGTKLKIPRTVAPNTQAMEFTSSVSNYATKTSPVGMNFATAFTVEFNIQLKALTGSDQMVVSRTNAAATDGWYCQIKPDGTPQVTYCAGATATAFKGNVSLPFNGEMAHVALVITSVSGKTGAIYINGVPIPTTQVVSTATTLTPSGNLTLGRWDSPAQFSNVYMSEVRIWSVARTQAEILANMNISLVGNEANLAGLFKGNGNFNDSTANANNLTAVNGAVANVNAASVGFNYANTNEYVVITKVGAFAGGVTPVTFYGGIIGRVPNQSLGTIQYSQAKSPMGFPQNRAYWDIQTNTRQDFGWNPTDSLWKSFEVGSLYIDVPTGDWEIGYEGTMGGYTSATTSADFWVTLSKINTAEDDFDLSQWINIEASGTVSVRAMRGAVERNKFINQTAMTRYYLLAKSAAAVDDMRFYNNLSAFYIKAKFQLL